MTWEFAILNFIQEYLRSPLMDKLMVAITTLGDAGVFWIALTILLIIYRPTRKTGCILAFAMLLEILLVNVTIKPLVGRLRPCDINTSVELLIPRPHDASFPSGHTAQAFVVIATLFYRKSKLFVPTLILGSAIAFSRLYLYVHFPTDVLAGLLLGWLSGYVTITIQTFRERNKYVTSND